MSQVADAYVVVRADMAKLDAQLSTLGSHLGHKLEDVGREAHRGAEAGIFTAILEGAEKVKGVFESLKDHLSEYVHVAAEAEQRGLRFNLMLRNQGEAIGYTKEQFSQIIEDTERLGTANKGQVMDAATILGKSGMIRGDTFKEALAVAQDMRVMMQSSLPEAAQMLAHALANPDHAFRMLRQAGVPATQELREEMHRLSAAGDFEALQRQILSLMGAASKGGATDFAASFSGQMERISAKVEETKVAIGQAFQGAFTKVLPLVENLLDKVMENKDMFDQLGAAIADGLGKGVDLISGLVESFTGLDDSTKDLIVNVGLFAAGVVAVGVAFAVIGTAVGVVVGLMGTLLSPVVLVTAAVVALIGYFVDWKEVMSTLSTAFKNIGLTASIVWTGIKLGISQMLDFFKDIWLALKAGFMAVWESVAAGAKAAWHNIKLHVMGGTGKFEGVGDAMGKAFNEELNKGMSANFGESEWTKSLKKELGDLRQQFQALKEAKHEALAKPKMEKVNTEENTRSTDYGTKVVKFEFEGLTSAWKKIQESMTGGTMVSMTKQLVESAQAQKTGINQVAENTRVMADKMGQPQPAVIASGGGS